MNVKSTLLIESMYAGPCRYYATIFQFEQVEWEIQEHFVKSSYRNRCKIASPDGVLSLSVPIKRGRGARQVFKDVKIFNIEPWQKKHWDSLQSAYRSSPYFEYYEDDLSVFYHKEYEYLLDWNRDIHNFVMEQLEMEIPFQESVEFFKTPENRIDMRSHMFPVARKEAPDPNYSPPKYPQVFQSKTGFQEEMSILDLLFAKGPAAVPILLDAYED